MPVFGTLRTFAELVALFEELKAPHRADLEQQILEAGPLRLHWECSAPYLHVTQALVANIPASRVAAVEHAIVQRNHDAQFPVLDFDAHTGTIAFRVTVVVLVDGVRVDLLQAILAGMDARVRELRPELTRLLE